MSVDHVRNRMTVQPFGGGKRVKVFLDERSHIYRNGTETTILGIHKGDRVYVDTMLADNDHILARNVRVLTENGLAEVRGQVLSSNPGHGTISVRDQLSSKPVSFAVSSATKYSSSKGEATAGDVQPGALIDVQFSPRRDKAVAQEITVLAKPGDNYIFSGVVTSMDMRTNSFYVDNKSDDQSYQVHFTRAAVSDMNSLKVGAEVTARAVFDGKQYTASNVHVEKSDKSEEEQRSEVQ
jgi:cold shock CspA family protein